MNNNKILDESEKDIEIKSLKEIGIMLLKPDALKYKKDEEIINILKSQLCESNIADFAGIYKVNEISGKNIPKIYPDLDTTFYPTVEKYLSSGPSIIILFINKSNLDIEKKMLDLRGKRMLDWTEEELDGIKDLRNGIRFMLPLEETKDAFKDIIQNIKDRIKNVNVNLKFTNEQYDLYCQNLVHTPEGINELLAILDLIPGQILKKMIGEKLFEIYLKYRNNI
jgi:hypothetical protein